MSCITKKLKIIIHYYHYIELIKPKIIIGNILSILGGFFIASQEAVNLSLLFKTITGTSLIIAANCLLNNIIDHNTDALMQRTKNRALVIKLITPLHASVYVIILFLLGFHILYKINTHVIYLSIISTITYIGLYTIFMKKKSIYSTLVGSISGAGPPAIGYCAITNTFDTGAIILTTLFIIWQIAHFYSIAIFRFTDYKNASIPTVPIKKGIFKTKQYITYCIILFMINLQILTFTHYTSYVFLLFMEILSSGWLYMSYKTKKIHTNKNIIVQWSKKMMTSSIVIITCFNIATIIDFIYRAHIIK